MWKAVLRSVRATFPLVTGLISTLFIINPVSAQQYIVANKDQTRPDAVTQFEPLPAKVISFSATRFNGYNEINWKAAREQGTRKFIVEYSYDGVNFQAAGQAMSADGIYNLKHYTQNDRPILYRIRIEDLGGKFHYSDNIFLGGRDILPVTIYPTVITGNIVNVNAYFPVQRVAIVSTDGQEVFAKEINGADDFMKISLPVLNKGWYMITFYGNGWKSTSKFMIG